MTTKKNVKARTPQNISDADAAYEILLKNGEPMYYKDLVLQTIEVRKKPIQSRSNTISEVYTMINMDSRFAFHGRDEAGRTMWGLAEWVKADTRHSHGSVGRQVKQSVANNADVDRDLAERRELFKGIQED